MNDPLERIARQGNITPAIREEFIQKYGNRGVRALSAIDEGRVKQYFDFTVVESAVRDYVVDEDICVCGDSLFRNRECWHILAVRLAKAAGSFSEEKSWYQERWIAPERQEQ